MLVAQESRAVEQPNEIGFLGAQRKTGRCCWVTAPAGWRSVVPCLGDSSTNLGGISSGRSSRRLGDLPKDLCVRSMGIRTLHRFQHGGVA